MWWIPFLAFSCWFYLSSEVHQHRFVTAWCFGFGYFAAGISWVHVSIADYGGIPLLASLGLMFLLCGYLALFPALFMYLHQRFMHSSLWALSMPAAWLLMEWLRAHLFTGFPWLSIGYSQLNSPLQGWIPIVGEIGISALLISITCCMGLAYKHKRFIPAISLILLCSISGAVLNQVEWAQKTGQSKRISMVQGNIPQSLRWQPEQDLPTMQKYLSMSESLWQTSDIIIWPEAAIPQLEPIAMDFLFTLDDKATQTQTSVITGIVNYNFESEQIYNNLLALGIDANGKNTLPYRYFHNNRFAKHHLLPIGEFVPFESFLRDLAPIFDLPMSSFTRGDYVQNNLLSNGMYMTPAICFEIAFPQQISANLTAQTSAIITVSNDAWFGASHGPHQHLQIAQMRAKEFALPVLRSTNNGISAFIDHRGKITARLPQFETSSATYAVDLVQGDTPYRQFGDSLIWALFLPIAVFALRLNHKKRR